jgi:hypothetical protein
MAKITVTVETGVQGINVEIDGKAVADVTYVSLSQYLGGCDNPQCDRHNDSGPYISISTGSKQDNGLVSSQSFYSCAEQLAEGTESIADTKTIPGFFGVNKAIADIAKFLS